MTPWKTTEVSFLKENFPQLGIAGCAAMMPHRSVSAIQTKARDLGLKTAMRQSNDLLAAALNRLVVEVEENGDTETAIAEAKSALRQLRRSV